MRILVAGMVAADPYQGGATSAVLQYVLGLEQLGHEVWLVDPTEPSAERVAYLAGLDLGPRAVLGRHQGPDPDLLLNISGMLRDDRVLDHTPIRVYLDLDPAFNQLWHVQGMDAGLDGHTHYATVGLRVPSTGHDWITTLPPVVLDRWPVAEQIETDAFTTVANFRGYGSIEHDGVRYGQKVHSLRQLVDLPGRTGERFAIALNIHPEEPDRAVLRAHGWELLDPRRVAGTPEDYAAFVRGSRAELGIAKEGYAVSRCGWFGDRSAAYLASGRPVVAQDTGFGDRLPVGAGLFAFRDMDGVLAAIEALRSDYARHARAARAIAEEHLDAGTVLLRLLREVEALPRAPRRSIHEAADEELANLLDVRPGSLRRRPFPYRSTAPLVELDLNGRALLLKDLSPGAPSARARAVKLDFLHDPRREIEVYRTLLPDADLGTPALADTLVDPDRGRYWLVVEKVAGTELYQLELERWHAAARWLARLHDRFTEMAAPDFLVRYDRAYFELWPRRAGESPPGYESVVDRLVRLPTTLVHGELYASNVLLAGGRVCVVDWELAGVGPGVLDLAALTSGLPDDEAAALAETYRLSLAQPPDAQQLDLDLDCARLHLAIQWLGWSPGWTPPPEHARDWNADIPRLAARVGL